MSAARLARRTRAAAASKNDENPQEVISLFIGGEVKEEVA